VTIEAADAGRILSAIDFYQLTLDPRLLMIGRVWTDNEPI
jgi:hypothetical protein